MNHRDILRTAGAIALATALPLSALAESLASSASSAGSASSGSVSDSIKGSSNSSGTPAKVAAGDYRIEAVTADDRPGLVRLALQAVARDGAESAFVLVLPHATVAQQGLARGDTVSARARPYGLEFARADAQTAFFLVLADDWQREIEARPLNPRM